MPNTTLETPKNDYLEQTYAKAPYTQYPFQLTAYLVKRFSMQPGKRLLDLGCGRGEFLKGFIEHGLEGFGIDQADTAKKICPKADIRVGDLEERLPYEDDFFDIVYSKSVVEHFYYPEKIVAEIRRVLKPGGLVITMTPSWVHNVLCFHEDYTHRTPFTVPSLSDIHIINGLREVHTEEFIQLPFVWNTPSLALVPVLVRNLTPYGWKRKSKLVRFSKEVMLLTSARK